MRPIHLIAGALVALVPFVASASTLEMRINGGADGVFADTEGDGFLNAFSTTVPGYDFVQVTATQKFAPPFDQLLANVTVRNNARASVLVEVTGHFENTISPQLPAIFTATANDALPGGSDWLIRSYIGDEAYGTGAGAILVLDTSTEAGGPIATAQQSFSILDLGNYWVTHSLWHSGGPNTQSAANADFAAIPVPAAGFLLIGALGGLAALKRRRKS